MSNLPWQCSSSEHMALLQLSSTPLPSDLSPLLPPQDNSGVACLVPRWELRWEDLIDAYDEPRRPDGAMRGRREVFRLPAPERTQGGANLVLGAAGSLVWGPLREGAALCLPAGCASSELLLLVLAWLGLSYHCMCARYALRTGLNNKCQEQLLATAGCKHRSLEAACWPHASSRSSAALSSPLPLRCWCAENLDADINPVVNVLRHATLRHHLEVEGYLQVRQRNSSLACACWFSFSVHSLPARPFFLHLQLLLLGTTHELPSQ